VTTATGSATDQVAEASRAVETLSAAEALARLGQSDTVFVDVRDGEELSKAGKIAGAVLVRMTMVSPAGHARYRGPSSLARCTIRRGDPATEDVIRRARHDCKDGDGGSGFGPFDEAGRLITRQSASSVMNANHGFDPRSPAVPPSGPADACPLSLRSRSPARRAGAPHLVSGLRPRASECETARSATRHRHRS
jgi:hypothetical protein